MFCVPIVLLDILTSFRISSVSSHLGVCERYTTEITVWVTVLNCLRNRPCSNWKLPPELANQCPDVFSNSASKTLNTVMTPWSLLLLHGLQELPIIMMLLVTANAGQRIGALSMNQSHQWSALGWAIGEECWRHPSRPVWRSCSVCPRIKHTFCVNEVNKEQLPQSMRRSPPGYQPPTTTLTSRSPSLWPPAETSWNGGGGIVLKMWWLPVWKLSTRKIVNLDWQLPRPKPPEVYYQTEISMRCHNPFSSQVK